MHPHVGWTKTKVTYVLAKGSRASFRCKMKQTPHLFPLATAWPFLLSTLRQVETSSLPDRLTTFEDQTFH